MPSVRRTPGRPTAGFTLVEMLVTLAVIGLAMTLIFGYGETLLPQTRLNASSRLLGSDLRTMRGQAMLVQREIEWVYHLDDERYSAHYPVEQDEDGRVTGPGTTEVLAPKAMEPDIVLAEVRLADGSVRTTGDVALPISPLGRMPPHDVLVLNRNAPDLERVWLRVQGLANDFELLDALDEDPEIVTDATFR